MTEPELVSDVPLSDAVGALKPSALPVDDVSNAVTQIKQSRDMALKGSLNQAVAIDPDKAAKNQALADKTGVPIDVINRNEEAVQQRARVNDLRALVSTSPILEQQMFNPTFAALAHDDAENLNIFERTLRTYLGASVKSGLESLLGVGSKLLEAQLRSPINPLDYAFKAASTMGVMGRQELVETEAEAADKFKDKSALELQQYLNDNPRLALSRFTQAMQEASTATMKNLSPSAKLEYGDLRYATLDPNAAAYLSPIKVVGDALQSLPTSLALGASVYLTRGAALRVEAATLERLIAGGMEKTAAQGLAREAGIHAGAETMARLGAATEGAAGYGQQYMQTRQQADEVTDEQLAQSPRFQQLIAAGYSPEAARLRLSAVAAEASGVAGGAVDAITNFFGGRFLGTILTEGGKLAARTAKGFATEALTEAVQSGGEQLAQNVAVKELLNPVQDVLDQVAENIAQGFVVGGVTGGAFSAVAGAKHQQEVATHDAAVLTKLSEIAAQSELRARAPETFAQFVNAAAADGPVDAVWIDAKGFAQSMVKAGLDSDQLAQKMPETAAALPDALVTNGKVRIPTGEFMATFPGTGVEKELIANLSTTPEGPTVTEAHDAAFIEEAKKQVEAVLEKQQFTSAIKESMGSVERELLGQLTIANRFTKDVNAAYAKLMASFYTVMGQRAGLTPEQMYVKYPLQIQAESVTAPGTLNQPKGSNPVGWWEGPGGTTDVEETNYQPTLRERMEAFADDKRWVANPNYKPEVMKSNRIPAKATEPVAGEAAPAVFSSNRQKAAMEAGEVVGVTSADKLSQGAVDQTETPEFKKWFGDSKVVDADGKPLVVYHSGTFNTEEGDTVFSTENGVHFGTEAAAQERMVGKPYDDFITEATFEEDEKGRWHWSSGSYDSYDENEKGFSSEDAARTNLERFSEGFDFSQNEESPITVVYLRIENPMITTDHDADWAAAIAEAKQKGHDGIKYKNVHEDPGSTSWIAFSPEQIKSAIGNRGTFNPNDPNILNQSAFDKPSLIIQHNISAENLHHAAGLGGIPVPSLAITRAEDAMTGFGEITLIGKREMANPRGYARTRVFGADVYSPRYPDISYKLDAKALKKLNDILAPYRKENERPIYGDEVNSASSLRNSAAFQRWAAENFKEDGGGTNSEVAATRLLNEVDAQQRIFRGFNTQGNKRYIPHTLENVVKILKQNLRGGETEANIYGMGQLRAKFTPQFKSIQAIKDASERIVSDEQFEKVKKEVENEFFEIKDALGPYSNRSDWEDSFHSSDTAMAIIEDAQRMGINAAVKEYGFDELPEDVRQKMLEFVTRLRNMPTEYFEAKILREVGIHEFAAAVVPEGTDQKTLDLLRANGLDVSVYSSFGPIASRKLKVAEVAARLGNNVLFQDAPKLPVPFGEGPPVFYSALQRQVEKLKVVNAPAEEWKKAINSLTSKGVKKAEIEASGVMEWLDSVATTGQAPFDASQVKYRTGGKLFETMSAAEEYANDVFKKEGIMLGVERELGQQLQPETPERISLDEVLAYLHSDGETEVRTTIFKGTEQYLPAVIDPNDVAARNERIAALQAQRDMIAAEEDTEPTFTEEEVEEKAQELWREQLPEEAEQYARESDYIEYEIELRVPNYRIEKLPKDMVRSGFQYGVRKLDYGDTSSIRDLDDLPQPRESWLTSKEFENEQDAQDWLNQHGEESQFLDAQPYDGEPGFIGIFSEAERETDVYDTQREAEKEADDIKDRLFRAEVDGYIEMADFSEQSEHYMREAREQLIEDRGESEAANRLTEIDSHIRRIRDGGDARSRIANLNRLRHPDSYQLPGGKEQAEIIVWVPGIEPYAEHDMTHYGDVGQGRAIAWARTSQFEDLAGKPVLMVNEVQSLRAQTGREEGFAGDLVTKFLVRGDDGVYGVFETRAEAERYISDPNIKKELVGLRNKGSGLGLVIEEQQVERGGVPPAPFVKDTQAWVTLDMKRVIRYAVDNGLDTVTWTTGKQQIGIYTYALRDEIKTLDWKKTDKGIEIAANGRNVNRTFSDKELRVAAGGAITDQIVNSPERSGTISGENIRFDAVWPSTFYGDESGQAPLNQKEIDDLKKAGKPVPDSKPSIVTAVTNKILAQIGGGKVESIDVNLRGEKIEVHKDASSGQWYRFENGLMDTERGWKTEAEALAALRQEAGMNKQPGFRITPEMKQAVLGGFAMFQGEGKRGQISFGEGMGVSPTTITLLQNADLSTFLHESGHFYLEVMSHMAAQENAAPEIKSDMQRVLKWFGVPNADVWNAMTLDEKRPYHEQFARGFESYLFEGTAPSLELRGVFHRFRAWMLTVYRQLVNLNVQLTDEVRGVFDRMLATNNEIIAAENQRGFAPLFDDAAKIGMSPDEWKSYQEQGTAATQDAVDKLQTRSLRDMKWLSNARSAIIKQLQASAQRLRKGVRAEVAAEVNAQPIYQAMRWLKFGETTSPEGEAVKAEAGFKLDTQSLATMYPATALGNPDLAKLGSGKYGMTGKEGLDPNLVAEMFGFGSGDELVRKLIDVEPARSVIEGMTDQRMLERYGDLTSPQAISAAADKAIHNELRARVLATEHNALAKATGQRKMLTKAAREFAANIIARQKLRNIRPAQYEAAEARGARAAEKALAADKLVEAATEKRNELINNYAAKAAHSALSEIDQGVAYLRKVAESKTIDPAYREQITAMLERFDLRQTTLKEAKRRTSLLEWMESQKDQGFEPVIDPDIANEAIRMPYQEMTMEQFRGLTDSVRNIEHLGRLKHKLLTLANQREFTATVDAAVAVINANAKKTLPQRLEGNTWSAQMKDGVTEFFAMHRKFASLWREMDAFVDGGKLWQLFVRPMNEAGNTETTMREAATIQMSRIFKPLFDKGHLKEKTFIPAINASLSREGRIMVALNTGNDGNLQRLMDGDHWTKKQVDAIVDTLTKPEMDFVQSIWDYIGSYRQQIGEQQKRLTGVAPEWVEPRQVITQHGVYAGGYLPAKYDTTRSTRALADEAANGIMDQWRGARGLAKTRDSFTKERASKVVNRPLRKDFGVITQHVTEVIHRLSWQEYLTDVNRLLRSKGIDNAIREHYGHQTLEALRDTLEDVATGELPAQNAFERSINYIRQGATIAGLGWRLTTALLQPFGLTQSMVRIGPKYVARGLVEWMGDSTRMENTAKKIYEKSEFMRLRAKTLQREINEIRNQVEGKNSALTASYFYLITKMQFVADIPTWLGQYHKAIESGADEMNARAQADQAVIDAQGSGQLKDLSAIQRGGPMLKLFTNFYSFFNTTYNMTAEAYGRTNFRNPLSIGRLMVDVLLLYSVPAVLGTFLKAALHSGDDEPDWEDKLTRQLIADQMTYWLGTMVGLREISGAAQTALGLTGDYQGPASVRLFASIAELGKQINQGEVDEALLKAADNVGGVLFHYPAGQINATVDGMVTMAQGKTDNPGALIVGSNRK